MQKHTAKVESIKVNETRCWVSLVERGLFILWSNQGGDPWASKSLKHSIWVSLIEHAIVKDLYITIQTESEESSIVGYVKLWAVNPEYELAMQLKEDSLLDS